MTLVDCVACGGALVVERSVVRFGDADAVAGYALAVAAQITHGDPECADWKDPKRRPDCIPKNVTAKGVEP